jgi:gamma-glutamyltranspeptidase/glutathione hydrolase
VSAWPALSERYGRLPFSKLFEPAINYARNGFVVSPTVARQWRRLNRLYRDYPEINALFFRDGIAPGIGALFRLPDNAETLTAIAASNGKTFYRGDIARRIAAHAADGGADLSIDDLTAHTAEWVEPLTVSYRDITVYDMPPNSQGLAALIALGILDQFDVAATPVDSIDTIHLQIKAIELAFADILAHLGVPKAMQRDPRAFVEPSYLRYRAA